MTDDIIFVFGSNLAGRHGAGSALKALEFGAKIGIGEGIQGKTYAIPTKDENLKTLPLSQINEYVHMFLKYAKAHPWLTFYVVEIGCGLAGYKPWQIAPMFSGHTSNVLLSPKFESFVS